MTPGEHYALNNYGDDTPNTSAGLDPRIAQAVRSAGGDIDPLDRARGFYIPGPYKLEGVIPDYDFKHPSTIRNVAVRRGFTVCRLAGGAMDISGYYDTATIRYYVTFTEGHTFWEASGEGWVFGQSDYAAFVRHIDAPLSIQAARRPAYPKSVGRPRC
jgi:hypothetical protein